MPTSLQPRALAEPGLVRVSSAVRMRGLAAGLRRHGGAR
jgi:hypothetical protein